MSAELTEALARIEDHFRPCRIEYAHIFRPNGELIHFLRGKKDKVAIPAGTEIRGNVLTHNHPTGGTFSAQDCYMMRKEGLREIRAYGKHGAYILRTDSPREHRDDPSFLKSIEKMFKKNPHGVEDFARTYGFHYAFEPYKGEALK